MRRRFGEAIAANRELFGNAASMVGTTLVTSLLGVTFWWLAAREFTQADVGVGGAAVSAMTLIGFIATVGLGTLLMGELPRMGARHRALINASLVVSGATGALLGLAFAIAAPLVASDLDPLSATVWGAFFFAAGVGLTAAAFVLDQALIGLLRGRLQLWRNVVFSVVKLLALAGVALFVADAGSEWIYGAWTVGIALSMLVLKRFYRRRRGDPLRPDFARLREMRVPAATHHAFNLALRTPELVLPVIVVVLLSAATNASFYIAWMIAGFLFVVPLSLSTVLYAIGSADTARLGERFRLTTWVSIGFGVVANVLLLLLGGSLLEIFGSEYADDATTALSILALGVFPETVRTQYVAVHRIERRIGRGLPIVWGGTILEAIGGVVGALAGGLNGVAIGWLAAVCIEALVMSPPVLRAMGRGTLGGPAEPEAGPPVSAVIESAQAEQMPPVP
jgi:O-antigen/teichoic acid export membrane protein